MTIIAEILNFSFENFQKHQSKDIDSDHRDIFERLALIVHKAWEGEEISPEIMKEVDK